MVKVVAENCKGSYKDPTVGVQLGRGHIDFGQKSALKPCEWEAKLELLARSSTHTGSPSLQGRTFTYTRNFSSASPSLYALISSKEVIFEVSAKRLLEA